MSTIKKIKQLFKPKSDDTKTTYPDTSTSVPVPTDNSAEDAATNHLSAISRRIQDWLDAQGWHYEHYPPDDNDELRTHHFVMGFRDDGFHWSCIIRIHEKNQLITFLGLIPDSVATPYYLPTIAIFTATNHNLSIGSLEFDVTTGTARAKIGVDGEFSRLTDTALSCYMQGIASLTEKAAEIIDTIIKDPNPNQDLLSVLTEQGILSDDDIKDSNSYFVIDTIQ